jgi:glucose-1-phosphate thymidylyltransferase
MRPKAVIPVAGVGTRLRPHTHTVPKALITVAGKPILAHILDELPRLGIEEVVLVVGHMGDQITKYVTERYPHLKAEFVEQADRLGLGHAVYLTEPYGRGRPLLIILGDTIFQADFTEVIGSLEDRIGVKEVEDPRRFGVVDVKDGYVVRVTEKPDKPTSNLAIVGLYWLSDSTPLYDALSKLVKEDRRTKGEYQLTDALQMMIDGGRRIRPFRVEAWFDCGKRETLLATNRHLLELKRPEVPSRIEGAQIIEPVAIDPTAEVVGSIIGPYVTIAARAVVRSSIVRNSIINEAALVEDMLLDASVVGDHAVVRGAFRKLSVGDSSEIQLA